MAAHLSEKSWCGVRSFREAFSAALDAFGIAPDRKLTLSFALGFGTRSAAPRRMPSCRWPTSCGSRPPAALAVRAPPAGGGERLTVHRANTLPYGGKCSRARPNDMDGEWNVVSGHRSVEIIVRGRVQGVGYRAWTKGVAEARGLSAPCATGRR